MSEELIQRRDDMSRTGRLQIHQQADGDVVIGIFKSDDDGDDGWVSVEFCDPAFGGGRSPNTLKALRQLITAIELDNKEKPIDV